MVKIFISIFIVFSLFLCGCTTPSATIPSDPSIEIDTNNTLITPTLTYVRSDTNSLRIRSAPNTTSKTVGYLDKGDLVENLGMVGDYYVTVYKEQTAYVHSSYCSIFDVKKSTNNVEKAISLASTLLGYPYVWGSQRYHWGNGKLNTDYIHGEYDCSALVQYVYYISNGIKLDLTTRTQVNNGIEVSRSDIQRGDLMFFTNSSRKNLSGVERIGHVGIYFGNNYILHTASDHAVIEPISSTRWSYFITARRVV